MSVQKKTDGASVVRYSGLPRFQVSDGTDRLHGCPASPSVAAAMLTPARNVVQKANVDFVLRECDIDVTRGSMRSLRLLADSPTTSRSGNEDRI